MKFKKSDTRLTYDTIEGCTRALQENPQDDEAYYRRGRLHRQNLSFYEAEKDQTMSIATGGFPVLAHFERGIVRWNQGKTGPALADHLTGVFNFVFQFLRWLP